MKLDERHYEQQAVTALLEELKRSKRVIAVGPTGCGKTVIASMLVKASRYRSVLFVAHRYELIDQAYRTLTGLGIDAGICMAQEESVRGDERVNRNARVQVASVQTLTRRRGPLSADLIIFDEAHHATAGSYQKVVDRYPGAHVLGLTATLCRMDGKGMGDFFRELYIIARPSELYEQKYLARPRTFTAPIEVLEKLSQRIEKADVALGDYTPSALAEIVNSQFLIGKVVSEAIRIAPDVPKLVFAGSVQHSQQLVAAFNARGVRAAHIDGTTDPRERERILDDLRDGRIEAVSNFMVLGEGFDLPKLGAVILARPTRSLTLFLQMTGRVMRFYKGRVPIVIDHGNNTLFHQVFPGDDVDWTLERGRVRVGGGQPVVKACPSCGQAIPAACATCPECGSEQEMTAAPERVEVEAKLEEVRSLPHLEIRGRVERLANRKGAPAEWVDRVLAELTA